MILLGSNRLSYIVDILMFYILMFYIFLPGDFTEIRFLDRFKEKSLSFEKHFVIKRLFNKTRPVWQDQSLIIRGW